MSAYQKNLVAIISVLGGIIAFFAVQIYLKVDKTYDFVIRHDSEIKSVDEDLKDIISRFNSHIERTQESYKLEQRDKNRDL